MIGPAGKTLSEKDRIRVLVVDDSVVIRRLVTYALAEDPDVEVVGSAANGQIALKVIPLLKPDVVTLDIEMPEMDGLATLRQIRVLYPQLVVIMFSTLSERGAAITIEALSLGANDYVTKAANVGSLDVSMARLRADLVPKVRQFFHRGRRVTPPVPAPPPRVSSPIAVRPAAIPASGARLPRLARQALAIGVSTGGPTALAELIPAIPENFDLPVFIVQHMPPIFTRLLAERLQTLTKLRIREATDGMSIEGGTIYIAPGDFHMRTVKNGAQKRILLDQSAPENFCRPAVDVLFRSVADLYGGAVIAVVLTGMGQDGRLGVERLRKEGAWVIAQDEASSVVWGMPGAVARAGLADDVVDLKSVVPAILRQI
ncbi:MAG TPA: chemotaxis response regulator protein-glutamate methylesterase [Bryobacteraceae bacterium]|nr:chemotaxis response regulator protein-glutamate methylesterase [Bryobacteraceae bacterium]